MPLEDGTLKVRLTTAPVDGKANAALVKILAEHFNVAPSQVEIVRGHRSKTKVVQIISLLG